MTAVSANRPRSLDDIDYMAAENEDDHCDSTLWHYTDAAGLVGILKSGKIWATHVAHLNDPTELIHGENLAAYLVENLAWPTRQVHATAALKHFSNTWATSRISHFADLFVASFCKDDGNRLSQWRGYGGACLGYSIGFRKVSVGKNDSSLICEVRYNPAASMLKLDGAFRKILTAVEQDIRGGANVDATIDKASNKMGELANIVSVKLKHEGFKEEREWRLVTFAANPGEKLKVSEPKYRPSRLGVVPYVEVNLASKFGRLPIERIFVGPAHNAAASVRAVQGLLKSLKYPNAEGLVAQSEIPFRVT